MNCCIPRRISRAAVELDDAGSNARAVRCDVTVASQKRLRIGFGGCERNKIADVTLAEMRPISGSLSSVSGAYQDSWRREFIGNRAEMADHIVERFW